MANKKIYNSLQILGNGADDILSLKGSDDAVKISVGDSGIIKDSSANSSIDPNSRVLKDSGGSATAIDWENRRLVKSNGKKVVLWETEILQDNAELTSVDWENRRLVKSNGKNVVLWETEILQDDSEITALDWANRRGMNNVGAQTLSWQNLDLQDYTATNGFANFTSLDWNGRTLRDYAGSTAVSWGDWRLYDQSVKISVEWSTNRQLFDNNEDISIDWKNRKLIDTFYPTPLYSLDWENRILLSNLSASPDVHWTALTQPPGDNSTKLATTAYVDTAVGANKYVETLAYSPFIPADIPITITHGLNSTDILVQLWDLSDGEMIFAKLNNRTNNSVDITFVGTSPAGDVRIVIIK